MRKPTGLARRRRQPARRAIIARPSAGEQPLAPLAASRRAVRRAPAPLAGVDRRNARGRRRSRTSTSPTSSARRLSNGIELIYARRTAVPVIRVAVEFDAGIAADPADALGTQALMLSLLDEGTTSRNSIQIAEEQERLGAEHRRRRRRSTAPPSSLAALTPNLGAVARSARRHRPQPGLRAGRGRAAARPAARRASPAS